MVRAGFFMRQDEPEDVIDPRYDVVVLPWRALWEYDWTLSAMDYQGAGVAVHVHVPLAYMRPEGGATAHEDIRAVLDDEIAWLLGANGVRVGDSGGVNLIDPRRHVVRRKLLGVHERLVRGADWEPDGLFLDFVWDAVSWKQEFQPWTVEERAALDGQYRTGMYKMALGIKFGLRGMTAYGNGWHRCHVLDSTVLENFPLTKQVGGERNLDVALTSYYGQDTWRLFKRPPMIIPAGGNNVAYDIPRYRIVEAVGFAQAFCPGAIVFDNSGYVFEAIGRIAA